MNVVILNAIKAAGLWETVLLNRVAFRVSFGPFASQAWFRQLADAASRFRKHGNARDPVYQFYLKDILEDIGESDKIHDEAFAESLFQSMLSAEFVTEIGPHIQFSRWGSIIDVGKWYDERWHKRLVLLIYIGLHQKWLKKGDKDYIKGPSMVTDNSDTSGAKERTGKKYQASGDSKLRNRCHNLLHMVTVIMMDKQQQRKQRLIAFLAEPVRRDLGLQAKAMRSAPEIRKFSIDMASGDWLQTACDVLEVLYDGHQLERLGMVVELAPYHRQLSVDSPEVVEQNDVSWAIVRFALQLMQFRIRQAMRWTWSLPLRFAALLSTNERVRSDALKYCKGTWRAWLAVASVKAGLAQKLYRWSFCNFTAVVIMCKYGERVDWKEVSPMMLRHAKNMFDPAMGQSKVIEDWGQRARTFESGSPSSTCRATCAWFSALRAGLLPEVHRWDEVNYADEAVGGLGNTAIPTGMFQPKARDMTVKEYYEDYPKGENPNWPAFNSGSEAQLCIDSMMLIQCHAAEDWSALKGAWFSALLGVGTVFKPEGGDQWYVSLGHFHQVVVCGWPLDEKKIHNKKYFAMRRVLGIGGLHMGSVLDASQWSCLKSEWASPLHAELSQPGGSKRGASKFTKAPHLVCLPGGKPMSLLQHCAWNCFFDLPLPPLKEIARLYGVTGIESPTVYDHCIALVRHFLPKVGENDITKIMSLRLFNHKFDHAEFLMGDRVAECFDDGDGEHLKDYIDNAEKSKEDTKERLLIA